MTKSLISSALMTLTMLTIVGCHATPALAPMPMVPAAAAQSSMQSAKTTGYTEIREQDGWRKKNPIFERTERAWADFLDGHPLTLRMRPRYLQLPESNERVESTSFRRLAARPTSGGATEFVALAVFNGGPVPHTYDEYQVTRTLTFTIDAKGTVTTFRHLDPSAFKDFEINVK